MCVEHMYVERTIDEHQFDHTNNNQRNPGPDPTPPPPPHKVAKRYREAL